MTFRPSSLNPSQRDLETVVRLVHYIEKIVLYSPEYEAG